MIIGEIRFCGVEDVPCLEELDVMCESPAWSRGLFLHHVASDRGGAVIGMFLKGKLRGFLVWELRGDEAWVVRIGVHRDFRRLGLGSQLMCAMEVMAMAQGCVRAKLHVRASNRDAMGFYSAMGFRRVELVPGYYSDGEDGELWETELPFNI